MLELHAQDKCVFLNPPEFPSVSPSTDRLLCTFSEHKRLTGRVLSAEGDLANVKKTLLFCLKTEKTHSIQSHEKVLFGNQPCFGSQVDSSQLRDRASLLQQADSSTQPVFYQGGFTGLV